MLCISVPPGSSTTGWRQSVRAHHDRVFAEVTSAKTRSWCARTDCRHPVVELPGGTEMHNIYVAAERDTGKAMIAVGDLNIAPLETDVWSHKQLLRVVSHTPIEVDRLAALQQAGGFVDAVRHFVPAEQQLYSWWSYRNRDWAASDRGRRLDHVWVTPPLVGALAEAQIHRASRNWAQPPAHVPGRVEFG